MSKLKKATARITIELLDITGTKVIGKATKTVDVLGVIQHPFTDRKDMHLVQLLREAGEQARQYVLRQIKGTSLQRGKR